jgi:hypothetical protein
MRSRTTVSPSGDPSSATGAGVEGSIKDSCCGHRQMKDQKLSARDTCHTRSLLEYVGDIQIERSFSGAGVTQWCRRGGWEMGRETIKDKS